MTTSRTQKSKKQPAADFVDEAELLRLYEPFRFLEADHWGEFLIVSTGGGDVVGHDEMEALDQAVAKFGPGLTIFKVGEISGWALTLAERALSTHSPYVTVRVQIQGFVLETEALVDTGFDGGLLLPSLRLPDVEASNLTRSFMVGDGRLVPLPAYVGEVEIVGVSRRIRTLVALGATELLLGRAVINNFRVTVDRGREVVVEP